MTCGESGEWKDEVTAVDEGEKAGGVCLALGTTSSGGSELAIDDFFVVEDVLGEYFPMFCGMLCTEVKSLEGVADFHMFALASSKCGRSYPEEGATQPEPSRPRLHPTPKSSQLAPSPIQLKHSIIRCIEFKSSILNATKQTDLLEIAQRLAQP